MAYDLKNMIERLIKDGEVAGIARNPNVQFGNENKQYLGATLLPERMVETNQYEESSIFYRTVIANDGSRYSPAQLKETGEMVGSFLVNLGNSDIARQFTGRDYDGFRRLVGRGRTQDAARQILGWTNRTLNLALVELNEKQRWDAIINAVVQRRGDNGYQEDVKISNPAGHRFNAGGAWSGAYDPWLDVEAGVAVLAAANYVPSRIITSRKQIASLIGNAEMQRRIGNVTFFNTDGTLTSVSNTITRQQLMNYFAAQNMPVPEVYDETYNTQVGTARFMPDDCMVIVGVTDQEEVLTLGGNQEFVVGNTLGYTGVGVPVGEDDPGRVIRLFPDDHKPPRIDGEAWQTSFPVITQPQAIVVIKNIT
jgi:hypothetical protein